MKDLATMKDNREITLNRCEDIIKLIIGIERTRLEVLIREKLRFVMKEARIMIKCQLIIFFPV